MEDLKDLGRTFQIKREELKLSLKEVENVTSIRTVYLQALEEGRAPQFLSPIYALGFLKQYAKFLGCDLEELSRQYPEAFRIQQEEQKFSYGIGTLETRGSSVDLFASFSYSTWIFLTLCVLISAWYFAKLLGVVG
ncbi:MAG: helix-turn-helix domain-containing protein [Chlamydiota bacterium]